MKKNAEKYRKYTFIESEIFLTTLHENMQVFVFYILEIPIVQNQMYSEQK